MREAPLCISHGCMRSSTRDAPTLPVDAQVDHAAIAFGAERVDLTVAIAGLDVPIAFLAHDLARRDAVQRAMMDDAGLVYGNGMFGYIISFRLRHRRRSGEARQTERQYYRAGKNRVAKHLPEHDAPPWQCCASTTTNRP